MSDDPLGAYGLVGNLETCALVGRDGGIDWLPVPHVESPSVFARLLDHDGGGHFTVAPRSPFEADQAYVEGAAVLETTFETDRGAATLSDFMPVATSETEGPDRALYRAIEGERGTVEFDATIAPRFNYATSTPSIESVEGGILARGGDDRLGLWGTVPLRVDGDTAGATFAVEADETHHLVLGYDWDGRGGRLPPVLVLARRRARAGGASRGGDRDVRDRPRTRERARTPGRGGRSRDGALLGNYPQAFSHLGVLTSALLLGCAKGRTPPAIEPRAIAMADR